jgi:hypothetical protein
MHARVFLAQETFDAFAAQRNFGLHDFNVAELGGLAIPAVNRDRDGERCAALQACCRALRLILW